ncbi:hypothetical protein QBC38DRAFT_490875 [Podospora fimiseda]|uniref:SH3 domain-containing protein n=1 Tax=Podospora fimiseda TaxID=252190 RepID=A0AAN6YSE1_9PEZI|nr:hypothetical protein QBC38DRAFT_490875 [Podospora fimiseda]
MGVDPEELLLRPFRDVVTLGTTALANATAVSHDDRHAVAADMAKAAQSLVREGERALKRLQAVWNDHVNKYGDAFKDIMVQQASIERRRFQLEEQLWDFDDVTKPEEFNQSRYSTLQAATKALALDIIETAKRLNPDAIATDAPLILKGGFPPLPPLPTNRGFYQPRQTAPASPPLSPLSKGFKDITLDSSVNLSQSQQTSEYVPVSGPPSTVSLKTASIMSRNSLTSSSALMTTPSDSPCIADMQADPCPLTPTALPLPAVEDGLMLMEDLLREPSSSSSNRDTIMRRRTNPRIPDCSIGPESTYHRLRGFCKGATKFRRDGHWDSIQRTSDESEDMMRASDGIMVPLSYGSGFDEDDEKVGKCSGCFYSHDWDEVEVDKSDSLSAVHSCPSASSSREMTPFYRLRLLYKSHLPLQSPSDEPVYACLWCIHASQTTRESDATVFFSASTLIRHIARHPQPLSPSISGLTVSYGPGPPPQVPVDLHLPSSPVPVPIPENVERLPTARAIKDHLKPRQKPPKYPEEGEMLHFAEGAVIVGVIFPEKWEGKWCLGRHDGCFGAFPAKLIELRAPQEGEVPRGGENGMSVVARWKWEAPSLATATATGSRDPGWVSFGKGDIIRDVQCLYADYWCWSGTNSKGKTGVFPSSHVDLSTLRGSKDVVANPTVLKKGSRVGRGLFSRRGSKPPPGDDGGGGSSWSHQNSVYQ